MVADFSCVSLEVTEPWDEEDVLLLRTADALRLCHDEGYETLPSHRALDLISQLGRRKAAAVRDFFARARLATTVNLNDQALLSLLRGKVRTGELALIRGGDADDGDGSDRFLEQRQLVREIEAKAQRGLGYVGRQYKLVVGVSLRRLGDRDNYEVVTRGDAAQVLRGLAVQSGAGDLSQLFARAAELLAQDWRSLQSPDGLVLLRRIAAPTMYRQADVGPALTPAQIKKLDENDWIEIEVVDQDDEPYLGHYRLELADKSVLEGELDEQGFVGVYEIKSGNCTLLIGDVNEPSAGADDDPSDAAADEDQQSADSEVADEPAPSDAATGDDNGADDFDFDEEAEPETKPIFLRLHMDPVKAAALKEQFRLFSTDGSYSRTEATDRIKGNAYMDLMFDEAPTHLDYSLEISGAGITPYLVFEGIPFSQLSGHH
jgi:hypothetical protein